MIGIGSNVWATNLNLDEMKQTEIKEFETELTETIDTETETQQKCQN